MDFFAHFLGENGFFACFLGESGLLHVLVERNWTLLHVFFFLLGRKLTFSCSQLKSDTSFCTPRISPGYGPDVGGMPWSLWGYITQPGGLFLCQIPLTSTNG